MKKVNVYLILCGVLFLTFLMRFPSLYEPFWYGDEGIFAAVGRNLNFGGTLYQNAWDNKPPMIYLTYAAIFKFLGVSMFNLHLVSSVVVLATTLTVFSIAEKAMGTRRALIASFVFGFLSSLRIVEGNLALTEIFMILPIALAMLFSIIRKFDYLSVFGAGFLFAVASLFKQVGALEAGALGIFLFFYSKSFIEFTKKSVVLSLGFFIPYFFTFGYFYQKNLVGDWVFAAYTYYRIYFGESPRYAFLINILKFIPIFAAIIYAYWKKFILNKNVEIFHLFLLWTAFSFLGSYFSGRTYGHYLVQALPILSLLVASFSFRPKITNARIVFGLFFFIPLIFLTKLLFTDFLTGGPINQVGYYKNFFDFSTGRKNVGDYNNYFDRNVNSIMSLTDFFVNNKKEGLLTSAYIWGDYPWLYAAADLRNPSRYVTSFHVFGVPGGSNEVVEAILENPPDYIIKPPSSIGYFAELENVIAKRYTSFSIVEGSKVFVRSR